MLLSESFHLEYSQSTASDYGNVYPMYYSSNFGYIICFKDDAQFFLKDAFIHYHSLIYKN